jgi:hypothetical protein
MVLLAALIVTGLGVGVPVDILDRPLGVLELHLLLIIALLGNVLLAFPLVRRYAVTAGLLLLLLTELLHKLLDLPALLRAVTARGLARALVTMWAMTPTSHYCDSGGSRSTCQRLVVVELLLPILVLVTALSNDMCLGLVGLPYLWSRLGMPYMPFCSPSAFVRQVEELRDIFHLMGGQLLKHLLISHVLSKSDNNRSIGDVGDGV